MIEACFSQNVVKTTQELIVAVSRIDTWKRNRNLVLENYKIRVNLFPVVEKYYNKFIPLSYVHYPMGLFGIMKTTMSFFFKYCWLFWPVPRGPIFRPDVFEIVTKTTRLACQNFMMALVAQGHDSCSMEGFDKKRVNKILK
ncbi:nitroreductase family protein [Candidatus Marinimicrobia bacterium]|nr:nitroreductase family protein [Candidatus Neomarinimicrobiota bacterium]